MYDDADRVAQGTLAHSIKKSFDGMAPSFNEEQATYASVVNTKNMLDYSRVNFNKALRTSVKKAFHISSNTFRCHASEILTKFLFLLLNQTTVRKAAEDAMTGASGHRRVPAAFYEEMLIPVPPIPVQQQVIDETGVIYILTNPSFPEYVKIGYADDIDKRLLQLNRSECIPFAFRVYATYEVNSRLSDLKIHSIIDKLNPNLRSIENFNGKQRIREFYAMSPEDAYSILEAIAEIHGCADKLKRIVMDEAQKQAEETAQEIDDEHKERQSPFRFSMCNIQPGEEREYCNNPEIKCTIVDDKTVSYQGQIYSLSALAQLLTGSKYSVAGPRYFKYRGEWLNDVRHRQER